MDYEFEYEDRLVAFIDVMGFKELLKGNAQSLKNLKRYYGEAIEYLQGKSGLYAQTAPQDNFKKIFVSDSIILTVELSNNVQEDLMRTARFFRAIGLLQYVLAMKAQIWTRGAVSIGKLYLEEQNNILVGPAFVQAYELEKLANYPRVIIDPKLLKHFTMTPHDFVSKINSKPDFQGNLLGINSPNWLGIPPFINDAIQIDWFRQVYDRHESMDKFFEDLRARQYADQNLFSKANSLIRYLVESYLIFNNYEQAQINRNAHVSDRCKAVRVKLSNTSGYLSTE